MKVFQVLAAVWSVCLCACTGGAEEPPLALSSVPTDSGTKRAVVVFNRRNKESREIAELYAAKRGLPPSHVISVACETHDNMPFDLYKEQIEAPVRQAIRSLPEPVDFIVVTKGIPIRLRDNAGYSLDGHLACMDLALDPISKPDQQSLRRCLNPYFGKNESFSSQRYGFYLVTRLDGYTAEDAKRLIESSAAAKPNKGPFLIDSDPRKAGPEAMRPYHDSLSRAGEVLQAKGFQVILDRNDRFVGSSRPLAGYASWGSNDGSFDEKAYKGLKFLPGAIAETFVSYSARTFGRVEGGQSVITDLIAGGITGAKGYVSEPYTFALARPDILFDRYTAGFTLAESFSMASPILKWKDVVVGDPLCAPYAKK